MCVFRLLGFVLAASASAAAECLSPAQQKRLIRECVGASDPADVVKAVNEADDADVSVCLEANDAGCVQIR